MGTRGSVGFIYKDKPSLTYNHFDSYPSGLGTDVVNMIVKINEENGWDKFKENAAQLNDIQGDEITDQALMEKYKKYSDLGVSRQTLSDPYCLFRKIQGAEWMEEMYKGELHDYPLNNNFIKDSLFCEYAYIINLDDMLLEFYNGFQKKPQKFNKFGETSNGEYYPCRVICVFPLNKITDSSSVINKMEEVCESEKDDISVEQLWRKPKLEKLNSL